MFEQTVMLAPCFSTQLTPGPNGTCTCLPVPGCSEGVDESIREEEGFYIRSGIVTVLKNATIPAGTII